MLVRTNHRYVFAALATALLAAVFLTVFYSATTKAAEKDGSVGLEAKINSPPPTQAASITFPRDGTNIDNLPVTVTGICPKGTTVKIFKNNVFGGSADCPNGSFSIQIDLFSGRNELVARVYDSLDQQGPDSNIVVVNFPFSQFSGSNRISLTSAFAKKGANPGETLLWPIALSGGEGPYAITVDWGDGKTSDIISQSFAGVFNIKHVYDNAGTYTVIVRATDKNGDLAFLQLIGVGNGPLKQDANGDKNASVITKTKILWLPAVLAIPLIILAFIFGRRHELQALRKQLEREKKNRS